MSARRIRNTSRNHGIVWHCLYVFEGLKLCLSCQAAWTRRGTSVAFHSDEEKCRKIEAVLERRRKAREDMWIRDFVAHHEYEDVRADYEDQ